MDKVQWARLTGQVNQVKSQVAKKQEDEALKEACAGFEAIFTEQMMGAMRKTLPGNGLFETSNSMDIYQSMHDRHLSDKLSQAHGGLGIKEFLYRELKKDL